MKTKDIKDYLYKASRENPGVAWLRPEGHNNSIPHEMSEYIKRAFTQVDEEDYKGRKWFKVHDSKYDSKYGAYMICLVTEEWRNTTASEFYGVGSYDHTGLAE